MIAKDKKRLPIRAFFFPFPKPIEPNNNWLNWLNRLYVALMIGAVLAIVYGIITGEYETGLPASLGFLVSMGWLFWFDKTILLATSERKLYKERKEQWNNSLKKWGLTEELFEQNQEVPIFDWLKEDMQTVIQRALNSLGLTKQELLREPMVIYGPLFWSTYGIPDDELLTVKFTDGSIVFSCYQLVVVCLSAERIATYSADFNFLRYAFLNEKSVEYLYRDIVSVSTEEKSTNYSLPNGKTMRRAQIFRLAVPGDNIEIVINSPEIRDLLGGKPKLSDHEQSVRVIREMLRTKKG